MGERRAIRSGRKTAHAPETTVLTANSDRRTAPCSAPDDMVLCSAEVPER